MTNEMNHTTQPKANPFACEICGDLVTQYGHNALPVIDGRCCDECNAYVVIPARLKRIKEGHSA